MSFILRHPWLLKLYLLVRPAHSGPEGILPAREAFNRLERKQAILVDVREASEIAAGMATGAVWVPTSDIKIKGTQYQKFLSGLDRKKEILVYCAAGVRAGNLVKDLTQKGFRSANVGGFKEWQLAGLPISKP